jgi:hypothetical protein
MNYYVITFGFEDTDENEYKVAKSKSILAENEDEACTMLIDQFEMNEGVDCDIISVKLIEN